MGRATEFFACLWVVWAMIGSVAWVFEWWTPQQSWRWLITVCVWCMLMAPAALKHEKNGEAADRQIVVEEDKRA